MRKILHADCDCFYAAVEMRDAPHLSGVPLAIGASPAQRGVVATCNYPARAFGIHSAMPTARALRLCPELTLLPPDFDKYRQVSAQIQSIFHQLTPWVEPLSLDEAYLDVSEVTGWHGSGTWMARWLKQEVLSRTGITVSVGVAPNKFLAKIASDWEKPDGLFVITPDAMEDFVSRLEVKRLHGVGPATAAKLEGMGIRTCTDLRHRSLAALTERFGKFGYRLFDLARGVDDRPVKVERERKSVSAETTFHQDLPDLNACRDALSSLIERLNARLQRHGNPAIHKLFVKIRFDNFSSTTLESSGALPEPERYWTLLENAWQRGARPVRLLGVGVRLVQEDATRQLGLFD
ncbi:DNA polymerase IV [Halomonas sp. WWR20]